MSVVAKRVLVTGGAGFLGSHLCERLLAQGDDVLCVDNYFTGRKDNVAGLLGDPHFEALRHDITHPLFVEVDEIYNLACPASPIHYQFDPVQTTKTSVIGAINMLGLAKRLKSKIFQASTSEVYGDPGIHPQPETYRGNVNPIGPRACYDEGKRCAETLFFDYFRQHQMRIKVARIFNTYGPRMHPNDGRVVSNFIVQALQNAPITLYGDGSQTRAFCFVDDLIDGFVRLMATADDVTGPINLGNPQETSVAELAELVIALTGSRSPITRRPLPVDDPVQRCPDITLAATPHLAAHHPARRRPRPYHRLFRSAPQRTEANRVRSPVSGRKDQLYEDCGVWRGRADRPRGLPRGVASRAHNSAARPKGCRHYEKRCRRSAGYAGDA
jgi:UDP-glucuronate decarboxylase